MTGYMAFLATRPHVPDIGPVGTVPPQNNFALEAFYTMKKHTPATGHRMLADVRNIVSHLIKVGVGFFFGRFMVQCSLSDTYVRILAPQFAAAGLFMN